MNISIDQIIKREGVSKWLIVLGAVVGIVVLGYFGTKIWEENPEILERLPATALRFVTREPVSVELEEEVPELNIILPQERDYIEVAEKGDGITHLVRRALREYLAEKPQNFEVTPEHKIYVEDYTAKKIGADWLQLGEIREISGDLIKEAIEIAETLTPEQLQNLTQYSQLAPFLNY